MSIEQVVEKTAHNPAKRYGVVDRGFVREGYSADLVLVDTNQPTIVSHENVHYHCGWTPFDSHHFSSRIQGTWVNGQQVYDGQQLLAGSLPSQRLSFNK